MAWIYNADDYTTLTINKRASAAGRHHLHGAPFKVPFDLVLGRFTVAY